VATYVHCVKQTSRSVANIILALFDFFLGTTTAFAGLNPPAGPYSLQKLPRDISTCIKYLDIDPVLNQTISCPQCFTQYPLNTPVTHCQQRPSPRSNVCGEALRDTNGRPQKLYTTQSLSRWLEVFLRRPGYADLVESHRASEHRQDDSCDMYDMYDIWDSPLWNDLQDGAGNPFFETALSLGFSLFVDWFNPWGNKAAGKTSCHNYPSGLKHAVH